MASSSTHTTANLALFRSRINEWETKQVTIPDFLPTKQPLERREGKDDIVAFRTRSPLQNEEQRFGDVFGGSDNKADSDAPVEFCTGISVQRAEPGLMVVHMPGMKWSGPTLTHRSFEADLAFGSSVTNDEVYTRAIEAQDILNLVLGGGVGCVLSYGQTGSGKTHTMEALEYRIARDLFPAAETLSTRFRTSEGGEATQDSVNIFEISVAFLELLGKCASDLLESAAQDEGGDTARKEVVIQEDKIGDVRPKLIETVVKTSEELQSLVTRSLSHRRTSATLRNASSSRSHAVLTIRVKNLLLPYGDQGQLILVDLAGSERYEDSKSHDKQRMNESKENNTSFMNLKECVRAKAKMAVEEEGFVHIPWRMNKLTMVLKPIFDIESRQRSKTIVIAHVSPHLQDSAHSVNTLSYASTFKMNPPKPRGPTPYDETDPRTWDHDQTVQWFTKEFTKHVKVRRDNAYKERKKAAIRNGNTTKPLNPDAAILIPVDIGKLCPAPMVGKNVASLYSSEFIERCLQASRVQPLDRIRADEIKKIATLVHVSFDSLLLTARTRTRNELMKSRKKLASADVYGEAPIRPD